MHGTIINLNGINAISFIYNRNTGESDCLEEINDSIFLYMEPILYLKFSLKNDKISFKYLNGVFILFDRN